MKTLPLMLVFKRQLLTANCKEIDAYNIGIGSGWGGRGQGERLAPPRNFTHNALFLIILCPLTGEGNHMLMYKPAGV